MKKIFKIFATAVATLTAIFAISLFAACGNNDNGGNTTDPATTYYFTVVGSDDKPINGQTGGANGGKIDIQICLMGEGASCVPLLPEFSLSEDGKVAIPQSAINKRFEGIYSGEGDVTEFAFQVNNVPGYEEYCKFSVTKGPGEYTFKLTAAEPEAPHECKSECPICGKCTDAECTEDACKDKCTGHVYELTVMLPDGSAANGAMLSVLATTSEKTDAKYTAGADGKISLDLVMASKLAGIAQSYTLTVKSGEYSKTLTIQATSDNYKLTINLEA